MTAIHLERESGPLEVKRARSDVLIGAAVCRNRLMSAEGLRERLFALVFSNLVYPQIWEDPAVDLEALALEGDSRIITIASGGCNVLNYLAAAPAHITAVDINAAHVALNRLKLAALSHLPDYDAFYRFFGEADKKVNITAFKQYILPHLDPRTAAYWCGRYGLRRRRRIGHFARNFYRAGLLGSFIGASHLVARLHGVNPRGFLAAQTIDEQRRILIMSWRRCSANGQCAGWSTGRPRSMASVFRQRSIKRLSARWRAAWPRCCASGSGGSPATFR
jgi:S-adenosylmethionine-diacylglycerol 3-amino-3-carboxypropyl transferase